MLLSQVSPSYHTAIKKYKTDGLDFYQDLLQVTIGEHAVILDLHDINRIKELHQLENISQFMGKDKFLNTGYRLATLNEDQFCKELTFDEIKTNLNSTLTLRKTSV